MCKRDINQFSLACPPMGTWPATQACTLTGNWISDLLVHSLALKPLSHTSRRLPGEFLNPDFRALPWTAWIRVEIQEFVFPRQLIWAHKWKPLQQGMLGWACSCGIEGRLYDTKFCFKTHSNPFLVKVKVLCIYQNSLNGTLKICAFHCM